MAKAADDKVVMTRDGYEKLKAELVSLRGDGRAEIAAKLEEARAFGDLSENAEYHAAKEEQEKLENRVLQLEYQLSKAQIVETEDIDTSVVSLGTTVTLADLNLKKTFVYTLVGTEEADIKDNRISAASPVGKAVMGKRADDEVMVRTPRGIRHLKVVKIQLK
ncbi:MAG: transcription elongation factor GreA [Cloacibacillus porcorum]|uniref:transcription elongation factor GreA n=1 Tax=Cloacibacillus porcorum TaxID=1197717 RepID=UPI0023F1AF96|nr:transcription elongation factor GreA [Cloacibacillus porcorum]MCD7875665.1 transcription elongation factor GreA [Cloacibacillus porcorum]